MSESSREGETLPIFDGLSPDTDPSPRRSRRARLSVAAAGALPLLAAASASLVASATTVSDVDPTAQQPVSPEPTPEQLLSSSSALGHMTHTVIAGESLTSIAAMHKIPTAALLALNGLSWHTALHEGQELVVSKRHRKAVGERSATMPEIAESPILESGIRADDLGRVVDGGVVNPLTTEMATNARIIIQVGRELGVPNYGIVIALAAAAQESHLRNLDYGDRDSLGLFQQRPSTGWGTEGQLRDPRYAARAFFGGPQSPTPGGNAGLLDIPGWERMSVTDAAQAVQISAFPDAYAKWEVSAWHWLFELT